MMSKFRQTEVDSIYKSAGLFFFVIALFWLVNSCDNTYEPPVVGTGVITDISHNSAMITGYVYSDMRSPIISRGFCWDTSDNPTVNCRRSIEKGSTGKFSGRIINLEPSTIYFSRAYAKNLQGIGYGRVVQFNTDMNNIEIRTRMINYITHNSAESGGDIIADVGNQITARGICWSTSRDPTIDDNKTINGTGAGGFSSILSNLSPGTTYYVRSYAIGKEGPIYGNELYLKTYQGSVTDIDNNIYYSVRIGNQEWLTENMKVLRYSNGDLIGSTNPVTADISAEASPKYQWPVIGDERQTLFFGRLYTWYAATDSRKICPTGWHLPDDNEWSALIDFLGGEQVAGGKMKNTESHFPQTYPIKGAWEFPNIDATNASEFNAFGCGSRSSSGLFSQMYFTGTWWSSTDSSGNKAYIRYCSYQDSKAMKATGQKSTGYSVRCIRD